MSSYEMLLQTRANPWRKARSVNFTTNGYTTLNPTLTEPIGGDGADSTGLTFTPTATSRSIIDLTNDQNGGAAQNGVRALFYGAGSNTNTFSCRLVGWSCMMTDRSSSVTPGNNVWIPTTLCEVQVTIKSAIAGPSGGAVTTTDLFADTIALVGTTGTNGQNVDVFSPADGASIAHIFVDLKGAMKLEFSFTTGGSATNCNALYMLY